jgi:hypothetical protein
VRRIVGSDEFINGINRWCLWLADANPAEHRTMPKVMERVKQVEQHRRSSTRPATIRLAETPALFGEIRQPVRDYLIVPKLSSERRRYIPIGFMRKEVIASDLCLTIADAMLYHFGVLTSAMHMVWVRQVCERFKNDYRYSNNLVYNNFPWPENPTDAQRERVESLAQAVLVARAEYPSSTLADLYDPLTMPRSLLDAHRRLDAAVDRCYRTAPFTNELNRLEFLFNLYRKYTQPLIGATERPRRPRRRRA